MRWSQIDHLSVAVGFGVGDGVAELGRPPSVLRLVELHLLDLDVDDLGRLHRRQTFPAVPARLLRQAGLETKNVRVKARLAFKFCQKRGCGAVLENA